MSCCPVGSEPALSINYKPRGEVVDLSGTDVYCVGSGDKCILVFYDIFGFNGGRTKHICDQLADAGYRVALTDVYHRDAWPADKPVDGTLMPWLKQFTWEKISADIEKTYAHLQNSGGKSFACLGFCFGAWLVFRECRIEGRYTCGASMHPSVQVGSNFGDTPEALAESLTCPQLLYNSVNELPTYKEGGEVNNILRQKFSERNDIRTFEEMAHGWVSRGDVVNENVAREVKVAMTGLLAFLKKHLP